MRITYHKKRTKNTGNYENIVVEIGIEEDINFKETPEECFERIETLVNTRLEKAFDPITSKKEVQDDTKHLVDAIKSLVTSLIDADPKNKDAIKILLTEFGVTKISEIKDNLLEHFYTMLMVLSDTGSILTSNTHKAFMTEQEMNNIDEAKYE